MRKICTKCNKKKNLNKFSKHPKGRYGKHPQCNTCRSNFEKKRYLNGEKEKRKLLRPYSYEKQLKDRYKITLVEYNSILKRQKNRCGICQRKIKLVVDHDHLNKNVRGLLCTKCNTGLGKFNDNIEMLNKAIQYLES